LVLLDNNYLSSPQKLLEYQQNFFENELVPVDIQNLNQIKFNNKKVFIKKLIENSEN